MVGASGAISAVLAAYGFLYPRSPITVFNPIFILWFFFGIFLHLPAWLVIGEYFVVNLSDALMNNAQGGVAFMAHVGGFVGGAFLLRLFMAGRARHGRLRAMAAAGPSDAGSSASSGESRGGLITPPGDRCAPSRRRRAPTP